MGADFRWVSCTLTMDTLLASAADSFNTAAPSSSFPSSLDASLSPPSMTFRLWFGDVERQEDRERERGERERESAATLKLQYINDVGPIVPSALLCLL